MGKNAKRREERNGKDGKEEGRKEWEGGLGVGKEGTMNRKCGYRSREGRNYE